MKKIFKLFLCLLMLVSFTNVTKVFAEEGEYVSAKAVAANYKKTNYMRALLISAGSIMEKAPNKYGLDKSVDTPNLNVEVDEDNQKIYMIADGETFMTLDYTDEYISMTNTAPATIDEANEKLLEYFATVIYGDGWLYAVLDTMGYSEYDIEVPEDVEEDAAFYSQYGVLMTPEDFHFEDGEGGTVDGTFVKEFKISLNKAKITELLDTYGVERPDYLSYVTGYAMVPELSIRKKNASLVVSWGADENATKYVLYRSEKKNGTYTKVYSGTAIKYVDKNVTYGKAYYYKVRAIAEKNKPYSEIKGYKLKPEQVKNVKLGAVKTNSMKLAWDKQPETGYVIERSTNNKTWTAIKTITSNSTLSYVDKGLAANKRYYYRVRAYKTVGRNAVYGAYSEVVNALTAPDKPTIKVATDTYESLKLTVTPAKGTTKYEVYRSLDGSAYTKVGEAEADYTEYVDDFLRYGKTYSYKVRGCNKYGKCGTFSSVASAKVALKKPTVKVIAKSTTPMTIKVGNIAGVDGYEIYRSTKENGTYKMIKDMPGYDNSYQDTGAKYGKTYFYKVRSYVTINGKKKYSAYSTVKEMECNYKGPDIRTKMAQSVLEFEGVYKNGNNTLKIYSITEEVNVVEFEGDRLGGQYDMEFESGRLSTDFFGNLIKVELIDGGVFLSGGSSEENGVYTYDHGYSTDDFFADHFGDGSYMNTKYNGLFDDGHDQTMVLLQKDENTVLLAGTIGGNHILNFPLEIDGDKAVYESFGDVYEIQVSGNVLTVRVAEEGEEPFETPYTFSKSLTKRELIESLY